MIYTMQYQSATSATLKSELATSGDPSVALEPYVCNQVHHMGYIGKLLWQWSFRYTTYWRRVTWNWLSEGDNAPHCTTSCCKRPQYTTGLGNWYFANGTQISNEIITWDFYKSWGGTFGNTQCLWIWDDEWNSIKKSAITIILYIYNYGVWGECW